jgi:hypothetical protein
MDNIDSTLSKFSQYTNYNSKLERASVFDIKRAPLQDPSGKIDGEIVSGDIFSSVKKQKIKIYIFYVIIIFFIYIVLKELTYEAIDFD